MESGIFDVKDCRPFCHIPLGGILTPCALFAIPSTSHWTAAAIIVRSPASLLAVGRVMFEQTASKLAGYTRMRSSSYIIFDRLRGTLGNPIIVAMAQAAIGVACAIAKNLSQSHNWTIPNPASDVSRWLLGIGVGVVLPRNV